MDLSAVMRARGGALSVAIACLLVTGCAGFGSRVRETQTRHVVDGMRVFSGECMSGSGFRALPAALAGLLGNVAGGLVNAAGTAIKEAGAEKTVVFQATLNVESLKAEALPKCVQFVHGPLYTNGDAAQSASVSFGQWLALDWERLAKANAQLATSTLEIARQRLAANGLHLAGQPRLFAEFRVIPIPASVQPGYALRPRALYYGEPLIPGGSSERTVALSLTLHDASAKAEAAGVIGSAIVLEDLAPGVSALFDDAVQLNAVPHRSWDTPWVLVDGTKATGPLTLRAAVTETRPRNRFMEALGTALAGSSQAVGDALKAELEKKPEDPAAAKAKADAILEKAAEATRTAITHWQEALSAYEACSQMTAASGSQEQIKLAADFQSKRVRALVSIAKAEPLTSGVTLRRDFLDIMPYPDGCKLGG